MRQRCAQLGLTLSDLCRRAAISRQTLYELARLPQKLPSLTTVVALAQVLDVHPMRLLQFVFDAVPIKPRHRRAAAGDRSAFVDDVSFPDGAVVLPGQRFEKTWALQNVGSVPWQARRLQCQDDQITVLDGNGRRLQVASGLRADAPSVALPDVPSGGTVRISAWFTTPTQPCTVVSYWKLVDASGRLCFPTGTGVWVMVKVMGLVSTTFADPPGTSAPPGPTDTPQIG